MKIKKHYIAKIHDYCKKLFKLNIFEDDDVVINKLRNQFFTGIQFWLDKITDEQKQQDEIYKTIKLYEDDDDLIKVYRAIKDKGYELED